MVLVLCWFVIMAGCVGVAWSVAKLILLAKGPCKRCGGGL